MQRELTGEICRLIDSRIKYARQEMTKSVYTITTEDLSVINFKQSGVTKMSVGVCKDRLGNDTPLIIFGAGTGVDSDEIGYIAKQYDSTYGWGLSLFYIGDTSANEVGYLKIYKDKLVYGATNAAVGKPVFIEDTDNKLASSFIADATTWHAKIAQADLQNTGLTLGIVKNNIASVYADRLYGDYISTWNFTGDQTGYIQMHQQILKCIQTSGSLTKLALGFLPDKDNAMTPLMVFGAGDGYGNNRGYITKGTSSLDMYYISSGGTVSYLKLGNGFASLNGYNVFSTADSISDSYIASASGWNNKLQKMDTSGDWKSAASGAVVKLDSAGITQKNSSAQKNGIFTDLTYSDFILYYNNTEYFRIYNNLDGTASLKFANHSIGYGASSGWYAAGTWDFTNATCNGLTAVFG